MDVRCKAAIAGGADQRLRDSRLLQLASSKGSLYFLEKAVARGGELLC